jgi:hypothetical protein
MFFGAFSQQFCPPPPPPRHNYQGPRLEDLSQWNAAPVVLAGAAQLQVLSIPKPVSKAEKAESFTNEG